MAKEKFSVIAIEETGYWADGLLESVGIEGAFAYYLIRNGERTHICSFTPNSWCYFIKNEFVYDSDNEPAHEWAGENLHQGDSDYFGMIDPDVEDDLDADGRETDAYHTAIWKEAEEVAHDLDCNNLWADVNNLWTYRQVKAEQLAKRHAMNTPPLGRDPLDLFLAAAKAQGVDTYEKARAIGWI